MFFMTKDDIPEGLGFSTFGPLHIVWLVAILAFCIVAAVIYKSLNTKNRKIMRTAFGCIIVFLEMLKNVVAIFTGDFGVGHLPLHLCGINILLIGFDLFKENNTVRNFLYYFCIPGALLALLFPNWTVLPCLNFSHIHSFTIHAFLVAYPLLLVTSGEIKPTIKAMPKCILLLVAMAIPVYFVNLAADTNFMFLMEPESGNPLELFEKYLGSHLWGFPVLLPIVMFLMYLPLFLVSKLEKKNKKEKELTTV